MNFKEGFFNDENALKRGCIVNGNFEYTPDNDRNSKVFVIAQGDSIIVVVKHNSVVDDIMQIVLYSNNDENKVMNCQLDSDTD